MIMSNREKWVLQEVVERLELHYNQPYIAPNGKLEGMCLCIYALKGFLKDAEGDAISN